MPAQITIHKAGIGEHEKQTYRDSIEFPALRKHIADTGFKQIGENTDCCIEKSQLDQPDPNRLVFPSNRNEQQ